MGMPENIRQLRAREGISQADLASMLGVSKETVSRRETGRIPMRPRRVDSLCALFGLRPDDVTGDAMGLAARASDHIEAGAAVPPPIPVYRILRSPSGSALQAASSAYAPADVTRRHPDSIFLYVPGAEVSRTMPAGSLALVNPSVAPWNGCIVAAMVDESSIVLRRYSTGSSMVMLSTHSFTDTSPDLVLDRRQVKLLGVCVWFQSSHELGG